MNRREKRNLTHRTIALGGIAALALLGKGCQEMAKHDINIPLANAQAAAEIIKQYGEPITREFTIYQKVDAGEMQTSRQKVNEGYSINKAVSADITNDGIDNPELFTASYRIIHRDNGEEIPVLEYKNENHTIADKYIDGWVFVKPHVAQGMLPPGPRYFLSEEQRQYEYLNKKLLEQQ